MLSSWSPHRAGIVRALAWLAAMALLAGDASGLWPDEIALLAGDADSLAARLARAGDQYLGGDVGARLPGAVLATTALVLAANLARRLRRDAPGRAELYALAVALSCPGFLLATDRLVTDIDAQLAGMVAIAATLAAIEGRAAVAVPLLVAAAAFATVVTRPELHLVPALVGGAVGALSVSRAGRWRGLAARVAPGLAIAIAIVALAPSPLEPQRRAELEGLAWFVLVDPTVAALLPWIAVVPIAVVDTLGDASRRRDPCLAAVLGWLVAALIAATAVGSETGAIHVPVLPIAITVAVWLARPRHERPRAQVAFVVAVLALVATRDLYVFPGRLLGLEPSADALGPWPRALAVVALLPAALVALALAIDLDRDRRRLAHDGAALAAGAFAALLSLGLTPSVAEHQSHRALLTDAARAAGPTAPIAIWRNLAASAARYLPRADVSLSGPTALRAYLATDAPVVAVAPSRYLCDLHGEGIAHHLPAPPRGSYAVIASGHASPDYSPLSTAFPATPPTTSRRLDVVFDDTLRLVGVDLPRAVDRGERFELTLVFEVLRRPSKSWRVFAHFEGPGRFLGDHEALEGACAPPNWRPGDLVVDRATVTAGKRLTPTGRYQLWVGLFVGRGDHFENMPVTRGDHDRNDRVHVGDLELR